MPGPHGNPLSASIDDHRRTRVIHRTRRHHHAASQYNGQDCEQQKTDLHSVLPGVRCSCVCSLERDDAWKSVADCEEIYSKAVATICVAEAIISSRAAASLPSCGCV